MRLGKNRPEGTTLEAAHAHVGKPAAFLKRYGEPWLGSITHISDKFVYLQHPEEPYPLAANPEDVALL